MKCSKLTRNKRSIANKGRMANGEHTNLINTIRRLRKQIKYFPDDKQAKERLKELEKA